MIFEEKKIDCRAVLPYQEPPINAVFTLSPHSDI